MKTRRRNIGLIAGLLLLTCAWANASDRDARATIQARNDAWTSAAASADIEALLSRYSDDATLMPEHARLRRGRSAVADYFRQWWTQAGVQRWERRTESVDEAGDHLIEIGRYTQRLERAGQPAYDYEGKYLVVWRKSAQGPRAIAELWGAVAPFERSRLPEIPAPSPLTPAIDTASAEAKAALAARNALISQLVQQRKGGEHAELFTADAAYLTYYTPALRGIDAIRAYFVEHERPGPVSIDTIDIRSEGVRPLDAGAIQLEEGSYRVGWRAGGDSGVVEGKSLNLWRRGDDGTWRLFRQAVNHD